MYRVPNTHKLHAQTNIPMGLIVQPVADIKEGEAEFPKAECGSDGPVRCNA
jgi:hypothetical protein